MKIYSDWLSVNIVRECGKIRLLQLIFFFFADCLSLYCLPRKLFNFQEKAFLLKKNWRGCLEWVSDFYAVAKEERVEDNSF